MLIARDEIRRFRTMLRTTGDFTSHFINVLSCRLL